MNRRTVLKLLGCMVALYGGKPIMAEDLFLKFEDPNQTPIDWIFEAKQIKNIIIRTKDSEITIPFSEIVTSLQDADKEG
jgi:hypothetical protein